jgi:aspartyl-tRNA(Asn)/glutamyl-tRNA(Gln) amidotransferase subunit A
MDDDVRGVWEHTLELLARDGAAVADVDLPTLAGAHLANARILAAEAAAIHEQRLRAQPSAYPDDVRRRLEHGLELGAATVAHARHHGALLRADLRRAFARVDVLVTPTLPCTVPSVGEDLVAVDGRQEHVVSAMTRFTNAWNLTGVPAGSVPAGRDTGGAPVGVQVVGPWFGESIVLDVMAAIERVSGGPWPVVDRPAARQPAR